MRIVTYLGFTLLSVLIQFSVMDFIQTLMQQDEKLIDGLNGTSQKRHLRDVLKDLSYKPHALYYQTQIDKMGNNAKLTDNTSLPDLLTTTEPTTAAFEVLYDDSTSVTEGDTSFTTEEIYMSTEFENVTDITFFGKTNNTKTKPITPKKKFNRNCKCNFLYEACDVNCCCDVDCTEEEIRMFSSCAKDKTETIHYNDVCYDHLFYFGHETPLSTILNDWFCIVKVNLPDKQTEPKKTIYPVTSKNFFTWQGFQKPDVHYEFTNKVYSYGDPIWLFKNGSIYYIDLPSPLMNNYCAGRKTIHFLKDQTFSCQVKIADLEMFQIIKSTEEASVISATSLSMNTSVLNCSNLHCVNWTLLICEDLICSNYNKSLHEPVCTESICTNLALKLEYIFNYHDSKIINATLKLHVQNVPVKIHFLTQEITVNFILNNESIDRVLRLSGNPGYIENMPVIVSYAESNYTDAFYNVSSQFKTNHHMFLPEHKDGVCVASHLTNNMVLFGNNRRMKCRYNQNVTKQSNSTEQCKIIQNNINELLNLKKFAVSPLGDPEDLQDMDWIIMERNSTDMLDAFLYGELNKKQAKLHCYNIITRYSFMFTFMDIDGNNRILDIKLDKTLRNASFSLDEPSGVVTIDVSFVDVTRPNVIEYASGPNLNFHLPNDFFLPFPSNESQVVSLNVFSLILHLCIAILAFK